MRSEPAARQAAPTPDEQVDAAWDALTPVEPEPSSKPNGAAAPVDLPPEWRSAEHGRYVHAVEELETARRELLTRWSDLDPAVEEWARRTTWLTSVWPEGLGYHAASQEGVGITLTRLAEARGELSAELTVMRDGMHLLAQRFNLSSGAARVAVARQLALHPFGAGGKSRAAPDWREILEQLSVKVLALERAGEPSETVGDRELASAPPRVIDPFLPEAVTLIWAPQGTGKSTLGAAVALTLEGYAEVIPGWHPRTELRVMVLDWEASAAEWNDRIVRVAAGAGLEPTRVAYRRMRRPLVDQVEEIAVEIDRRGIGFLVIDSYEKAAGAAGGNESYEAKASRMFAALDRLARPALVLDHIAGEDLKGGPGRVVVKSIGSVLKGAWARATYDLKRDPSLSSGGRSELVLHNVKMNDAERLAPLEFAIVADGDRGPIRFERSRLSSPELLASLPQREQLHRHLLRGAQPVKALAELMGVTEGTVRALVSRYVEFATLPGVGVVLRAREEVASA